MLVADLATGEQIAERLDVGPGTVRQWVRRGHIRPVIVGRKAPHYYHWPSVAAWHRSRKIGG